MRNIALFLLLLTVSLPAAGKTRVTNGGIYGGLSYFAPLTGERYNDFLYPEIGFLMERQKHFIDVHSALPILLPDLIGSAIRFLAGTDDLPPLWKGLNGDEDNPGRMSMFAATYRYAFFNNGPHKFDAGGLFDLWWMSPRVAGVHFGNITWNLAPSIGYGFASDTFSINLVAEAGNGFAHGGSFNPFVGVQAMGRVRLAKWFGIYFRGHVRHQSFDYSDHESYDTTNFSPSDFDIRDADTMVTAELGFIIPIGRSPRW